VGTGFNISSALLSAYECLFAAAAAWRVGRQRVWLAILAPVLLESAGNGAVAYFWFITPNFDPAQCRTIFIALGDVSRDNFLWHFLHLSSGTTGVNWGYPHLELAGFLSLDLLRPIPRSFLGLVFDGTSPAQALELAWICLATLPMFALVSSTWALPLEGC